jgi:hypothetical protein
MLILIDQFLNPIDMVDLFKKDSLYICYLVILQNRIKFYRIEHQRILLLILVYLLRFQNDELNYRLLE